MRFEFYGLAFETPRITFYLWSSWRATALENRLFEVVRQTTHAEVEEAGDELHLHLTDPKSCRNALHSIARVLKGWQEEADPGQERRAWRWMMEGDTDDSGYDHTGAPNGLWGFLRLVLESGGPGESEKAEDIDLDWFGLQIPGLDSK